MSITFLKRKVSWIPFIILIFIIIFFAFYQPFPLVDLANKIMPNVVWFGPTNKPYIALTFDDGPHPNSLKVLDILDKYNIKATFFVIGENAEKYPKILEEIKNRGHQVANHFYKDERIVLRNYTEVEDSLEKTEKIIQQKTKYLRPSKGWFGPKLIELANKKNYVIVLGSIYPRDNYGVPNWYIKWAINSLVRNGSIIVLHDNQANTIDALPFIIESAQVKDFKFVTLEEINKAQGN